jgi:hypothetical protein
MSLEYHLEKAAAVYRLPHPALLLPPWIARLL